MVDRADGLHYDIGQGYSELDAEAARDRLDGYAVVSGLEVTTDGTNLTLDVSAGTAIVGGTEVSLASAGTVTVDAADSTDPRKDTIYIDSNGNLQSETGVPEPADPAGNTRFNTFQPEPPYPSTEGTILAEVWVAAGTSAIASADRRDRRQPAESNPASFFSNSRVAPVVVSEVGGEWVAQGAGGEIASGSDPGAVINTALTNSDFVYVTPGESRTTLTTSTTISHTRAQTALVLAPGTTLDFTGTGQAVDLGGGVNGQTFIFDLIDANGADYGVRDLGHGLSYVSGYQIQNANLAAWYVDGVNGTGLVSNSTIDIQILNCNGSTTTNVGIDLEPGIDIQGHRWLINVILGPGETGVRVGNSGGAQSYRYHKFYVDIDGDSNNPTSLFESYVEFIGLQLEGYIQSAGEWDVILGQQATGNTVEMMDEDPANPVRVKRENPSFNIQRGVDNFGNGSLEYRQDAPPNSLDGYFQDTTGSGSITLDASNGRVEQSTGATNGSFANARKINGIVPNWASFDQPADILFRLSINDDTNQTGWFIWGSRNGPGVGIKLTDSDIRAFVHDGTNLSEPIIFGPLSAPQTIDVQILFNPPTDVDYWIDGNHVGTVSTNLPSGSLSTANQLQVFDFANNEAVNKTVYWSQYANRVWNMK
jgi:hypothetical protein